MSGLYFFCTTTCFHPTNYVLSLLCPVPFSFLFSFLINVLIFFPFVFAFTLSCPVFISSLPLLFPVLFSYRLCLYFVPFSFTCFPPFSLLIHLPFYLSLSYLLCIFLFFLFVCCYGYLYSLQIYVYLKRQHSFI